jgi:hypothetical protein
MPNRSTRDIMQGTLHRFAQSMGISPRDDDTQPVPPTPPPTSPNPPKTGIAGAADKLQNRQGQIDKAIDDAG